MWQSALAVNPVTSLLNSNDIALRYFVRRDLLDIDVEPVSTLWEIDVVKKLIKKQKDDGRWAYYGQLKSEYQKMENHDLIETYRVLGWLVEEFGFNCEHSAVQRAAEYFFTCQTDEGDIRGIYSTQYSPNYHAGIIELLIKAGYGEHDRVINGMKWLLTIRQDDGGWAIPIRTRKVSFQDAFVMDEPLQPDRSQPFGHLITGIVLRAFAVSPSTDQKELKEILLAFCERFFTADKYPDHKHANYWEKLQFPFWWTSIVSGMDSVSRLGITIDNPGVQSAVDWLSSTQREDGLWTSAYGPKRGDRDEWVTLSVCRALKRLLG